MKKLLACLMVFVLLVSCFACGKDEKNMSDNDASTSVPEEPKEDPTDTPADNPTEVPTEAPQEPTEVPTEIPPARPYATAVENLPEYYYDLTVDGSDSIFIGGEWECRLEFENDGVRMISFDGTVGPWINIGMAYSGEDAINPVEYNYIALRVKTSMYDGANEIRFGTESDNRAWSMIPFTDVQKTEDWQTFVYSFKDALYMTEGVTLDGSGLTILRYDSFGATNYGSRELSADDWVLIESIAFFKTEEEAKAYTGLYTYSE